MLTIDTGSSPPNWQVVVYDPRPESFHHTAGLELPFSCRDGQRTLLTGWVRVSAGDAKLGVWCLRGLGQLRTRPMWHLTHGQRRWQRGPSLVALDPDTGPQERVARPGGSYASPSLLRRLGQRRALLSAAVLILCAWGALSLALDVGESIDTPSSETATVARQTQPAPVLSLRVAILEQVGFDHGWVELRDALALEVLRTNGVTELHALLPGPDCILATDRGGRCELVTCNLFGRHQRRQAIVRQKEMPGGSVYVAGLLVGAW